MKNVPGLSIYVVSALLEELSSGSESMAWGENIDSENYVLPNKCEGNIQLFDDAGKCNYNLDEESPNF